MVISRSTRPNAHLPRANSQLLRLTIDLLVRAELIEVVISRRVFLGRDRLIDLVPRVSRCGIKLPRGIIYCGAGTKRYCRRCISAHSDARESRGSGEDQAADADTSKQTTAIDVVAFGSCGWFR
jgi:hypothetical protein